MSETRWARVESLFHEALVRQGEDRERFLADACAGDHALYGEVISLLGHYQEQDPLLEKSGLPPLSRESQPVLKQGDSIGSYEVIALLGRGGMGEVYLARDLRLGRKVAIKILPESLAGNPALIERLRREAQTASALNHPNILTIYEFGRQGDLQYIVSEFVDGISLREYIGKLSPQQSLDYARQIALALEASHSVGVVHRDIKPENVMVRSDGIVKVLDFGLAKLSDQSFQAGQSLYQRLASSAAGSVPGLLVGTINYMSPEQVRGQPLDQRTDIWSWGITLFEMLNGKRPFEAPTPGDVLVAILTGSLESVRCSPELGRTVSRALTRDVDRRYQTMGAVLSDLKNIPAEIDSQPAPAPSRFRRARHSWKWIPALALVLFLAGLGIYFRRLRAPAGPPDDGTFRVAAIVSLTDRGDLRRVAVSRSENYIAYSVAENGGEALKLLRRTTMTEEPRHALEGGEAGRYTSVTFSPDERYLYFVVEKNKTGNLYRVPIAGPATAELVFSDVDSPVSFSPDGTRVVFVRRETDSHAEIIERSIEKGNAKENVITTFTPSVFLNQSIAWSPDGRWIACTIYPRSKIVVIDIESGRTTEIGDESWSWIGRAVWIGHGRSLAVVAAGRGVPSQLWQVAWPPGAITELTHGLTGFEDLASNPDSNQIFALQTERRTGIWIAPVSGPADAQVMPTMLKHFRYVAWLGPQPGSKPDLRLISQTDAGGHPDLWAIDPKGGEAEALTDDRSFKQDPVVSPDGKYLVYSSDRDGTFHLWRSLSNGKEPVRLTSGARDRYPSVTPDGRSVIYTTVEGSKEVLRRVPMEGGATEKMAEMAARKPSVSPDGKSIVCEGLSDGAWTFAVLRLNDGKVERVFPDVPIGPDQPPPLWMPGGRELLFSLTDKAGVSNLWSRQAHGGPARRLTHFKEKQIFDFAISPDGQSLAYVRGEKTTNVVSVQGAKMR